MIVRILSEGQWEVGDEAVRGLNALDDAVEQAVRAGDQARLARRCRACSTEVRAGGTLVPDDELARLRPDPAGRRLQRRRGRGPAEESAEGLIPG